MLRHIKKHISALHNYCTHLGQSKAAIGMIQESWASARITQIAIPTPMESLLNNSEERDALSEPW